ncbi:MAG TPA: heme ABC exporter ATP-binding protein CcmA [Legionella sp.]|nr:heme ABC exporter ATP-binding protein CcmA [Legionella sp.]
MLDVIGISFDYQDEPILNEITFHVPAGGLLHLKGANGAGKTTLLKLVSGLYQPSQGQIKFKDKLIMEDIASFQRQLCFVGHKTGINPFLTLKENCFFDLHFNAKDISLQDLVSIFHLEYQLDTPCGLFSAGQRRQAGLLRLWMSNAPLWLLDEPLVALDEAAVSLVMDKIKNHREQGGAVLLTSHQSLPLHPADYEEYQL